MSQLTVFIIVNALFAVSLVLALLWLLGRHGIRDGVEHDLALIRRHRISIEKRVERDLAA